MAWPLKFIPMGAQTNARKRLILAFIFLASCLSAAPFPHIRVNDFTGPRTVIAGSRTFFAFTPYLAFNATVNASTNVFTVTGGTYTPVNGDIITPESTGTLPSRMYTIVNGHWPSYDVCNVSGSTFQLRQDGSNASPPGSCTGTLQTVSDTGTGTHTFSLYGTGPVYLDSDPSGFPAGTTFTYMIPAGTSECDYAAPTSNSKPYNRGRGRLCVIATVPGNAIPGTNITTSFTLCQTNMSGNCTTFNWTIDVVSTNISYTPPSSFTAIPNRTAWEQVMVAQPCPGTSGTNPPYQGSECGNYPTYSGYSGPANFCYPLAGGYPINNLGAATSSGVSYYGWNLLFDNMAIYTGNSLYRSSCFSDGMSHAGATDLQGVKQYVTANGGSMIGYAHFTESLFRAARVFNDSSFKTAGLLMQNNGIIALGPNLRFDLLRENVYGLDDAVALKKYGGLSLAHWNDVRDGLYSLVLRATESDASGVRFPEQMFMLGLAAHAIEADWQLSGDTRAPYIIKRIADYGWAGYDQTNHAMRNLEGPDGSPWCANGTLWFVAGDGNCGTNPLNYQNDQTLVVNAFWWYYAYTGDTTYRDRGDDWFSHFLDQGGLTGKQAATSYYDTFNAVGWRNGTLQVTQWYGDPQTAPAGQTLAAATCDLNADGRVNIVDVQLGTNQALGTAPCGSGDLNGDGRCTIVDVMRIVSASLGAACNTAP